MLYKVWENFVVAINDNEVMQKPIAMERKDSKSEILPENPKLYLLITR
jgi:hypothetical protein